MLRPLALKDVPGMLEWMHDAEIQKSFRRPMGSYTRQDAERFILGSATVPAAGGCVNFAVAGEDDEYLGTISLKNFDLEARSAEYAVVLRSCAHGKHVGKRASMELLKKGFKDFGLERIYLTVYPENVPAVRLYEKCGFVYEGTMRSSAYFEGRFRDQLLYAILREEYFASQGEKTDGNNA